MNNKTRREWAISAMFLTTRLFLLYTAFLLPISRLTSDAALPAVDLIAGSEIIHPLSGAGVLLARNPDFDSSRGFYRPSSSGIFIFRLHRSFLQFYRFLVSNPQIPPISEL